MNQVVRAAAGCGKTTDLARRYLGFLARGVPAEQAIAITFTRKAAAELKERVSLALRACLDGREALDARARLGRVWSTYAEVAPADVRVVRAALAALPDAPIGTTDAFVQQLLTEFALDAALPLPDGRRVALDLPITPSAGIGRALERAARRLLDPPDGTLDPDVKLLTRYFPLGQLLGQVARRTDLDAYEIASSTEVLGAAARWMATVLDGLDLRAIYDVAAPHDEASWSAALDRYTNKSGQWAVPPVARWLAAGAEVADAPYALCGWLQGLQHRGRRLEVKAALEDAVRSFGPAELSLWQVVVALRYPYDDPEQVRLADELRSARWRLRRQVVARGLEQAALAGELGYEELLDTAIALCEAAPERLTTRFRALLVDEVQDADPRQLRLYEALARLPDTTGYFVGDARQSIYLFRGAEPDGIRAIEERGRAAGVAPIDLTVNRRSAPLLVEAQRGLFAALEPAMRLHRWRPIADLDGLASDPTNADRALDPAFHARPEPVWVVVPTPGDKVSDEELDDRALAAFVGRVEAARREPGHHADTAAVLAPTWALAGRACRRIREWAGRSDAAFVEGTPGQAGGRVADDLALWLRALLDRGDDAAWLGLWKHPSVGLSDGGLARIKAGVGLIASEGVEPQPYWRYPGYATEAEALGPPHDPADVLAYSRARGPLRDAIDRIGRGSTSAVIDGLCAALGWRTVLAAGPGGLDDVAELEVLLDWIRDHDTDGRSADAILALFDDDRADRPHVHVERPPGHVACTTVFQAKGLAWDHVAVLRPGRHSRLDPTRDHEDGWMEFDGRRVRLEGLQFDPRGGLLPFKDPLGRLAARIHGVRYTEEAARLVYVAITRARRSVTLGLAVGPRRKGDEPRLSDVLAAAWLRTEPPLPGVAQVPVGPAPAPGPPPLGHARPSGRAIPRHRPWVRTWLERAPSSLGAHLEPEVRASHAEAVVHRIRLANGLHLGRAPIAPPGTDPATGDPLPGHPLSHLGPVDWGNLIHGWFADWRFGGPIDPAAIDRYLESEWGGTHPDAAGWIAAVCDQLAAVGGPVWRWVTEPGAKLMFEHALLGIGWQRDEEVLLSGRMDLLIDHGGNRLSVVDFKAGASVPTGWDGLADAASLKSYAFQLHAYADALRRLGRTVDTVALWFVRSGTSVRWTP
ncbi:MAG: UvrD-helicase domain-containing protein [Myxococcota bacterium]